MTDIISRLQKELLDREIDSQYDIWGGCYTNEEYDFLAREFLAARYPELGWSSPCHEEMLIGMALEGHAVRWKDEFLAGGWTREGFVQDGLDRLFIYYEKWRSL